MTSSVKVSIGMPVYNGERHVEQALDSVLSQTYGDFELVISDNASTDATGGICRAYAARDPRIVYERLPENIGAAKNFNRLIERAHGAYFKWQAHDDVMAPTLLERCVRCLDSTPPSVVMCFPRRQYIPYDWRVGDVIGNDEIGPSENQNSYHRVTFAQLLKLPGTCFPIFDFALMRSETLRRTRLLGNYFGADLILIAEMRLLGEFWEVPENLFFQRLHGPDAQRQARQSKRGEAVYLDPSNRDRLLMPGIKLFVEHLTAVRKAPLGTRQKLRHYREIIAHACCKWSRLLMPWALAQRLVQEFRWSVEKLPEASPELIATKGVRE